MRRFLFSVMCMTFVCVAVADEPKTETAKDSEAVTKAMASFTGTWAITTVEPEGATKDAARLVFTKDGNYAALDTNGKELWAGTFEIDSTVMPSVWDHRSHAAQKEGKDVLGIYDLNGDNLKVACVVGQWEGKKWVGKPRPKVITLKEADVVIELKRVK